MKGFVPTPKSTVDEMVQALFRELPPKPADRLLDPGCGTGEFIDGILRWCKANDAEPPQIVGVESDPQHVKHLVDKYHDVNCVHIEHRDFLDGARADFQFVIGNPPYVPITQLNEEEKATYRRLYSSAQGRFDLYLLFFEQAVSNLAKNGRLVFITPEKYLYVHTAGVLRNLLSRYCVEAIDLVPEDTFPGLITYPTITRIRHSDPKPTMLRRRDGSVSSVQLPRGTESWLPVLEGSDLGFRGMTLSSICHRISCGIATGADSVFILPSREMSSSLLDLSYPTISGRELLRGEQEARGSSRILVPYDQSGRLLPENLLGALGEYLRQPAMKERLLERTCTSRKAWYAFHETPILPDILRPKILCKDICERPVFVPDYGGAYIPRHSVYYIVPKDPSAIPAILELLNSDQVTNWLTKNCQRASKGFIRLQSKVLRNLPIPETFQHLAGVPDRSSLGYDPMQPALHF